MITKLFLNLILGITITIVLAISFFFQNKAVAILYFLSRYFL